MLYQLAEHELRQFAHEVAGAASVPFMQRHPTTVMPTEELEEGIDSLLKDRFGIDPRQPAIVSGAMEATNEKRGDR